MVVESAAAYNLGSDYDGIESTPEALEDVSKYPALVSRPFLRASVTIPASAGSLNVIVGAGTSMNSAGSRWVENSRALTVYDTYEKEDLPITRPEL
ncbi:hypothetical protein J3R83DRAFT_13328 [Lanmaoa asiatica]|nr:hypothetical protein J3R83DRAFT_13328 [Lanmaoa asiatica]